MARPAARTRSDVAEAELAVAAFAVLCVLVLRAAPYLPEPDDYAYRASVVAMTDGHLFTLSPPQARALAEQLAPQLGGNRGGRLHPRLTHRACWLDRLGERHDRPSADGAGAVPGPL